MVVRAVFANRKNALLMQRTVKLKLKIWQHRNPVAVSPSKSPRTNLPGLNTTATDADHVVLPVIIKNFPYTCSIMARFTDYIQFELAF